MRKNTIYDTLQAKKAAFDGYKVTNYKQSREF